MTDKPENPPAFPRLGEGFGSPKYDTPGMTLRDWFAGQALANPEMLSFKREHAARMSYEIADAMLAERTS